METKSPAWMISRPCYPDLEKYLKGLPGGKGAEDKEDLPWIDQEEEEAKDLITRSHPKTRT